MAEVGIEIGVYRFDDPTTLVDVLHERVSPAFLEEIKGSGGGDITLSLHDAKVSADPTLIEYRNVLRFKVAGRIIGGIVIGKKTLTIIDEDTDEEVHKVSGEGFRSWFNDAATFPVGGLKKTSYETRAFNFASEQGEWYDADQWETPVNVAKWGDIVGSPWRYAPAQWPDVPDAYWVWSQDSFSTAPAGDNFFRYEFDTTEDKKHSLFLAADDQFSVYIDGQPTTQSDPASSAYSDVTRVDFDLNAGSHVIGIRVTNKEPGPAALLAALFSYTEPEQVEVIGAVTLPNGTAVNCADHGLSVGEKVFFLTNGELPTGVTQATEYYVKSVTSSNSITISSTEGGAAISTSGSQSGVHTLNRPDVPAAATLLSYTGQSGWLVAGYPDPVPGWSPGEIVHTLLEEAETRGVSFPLWLTPTFTASEDSYGNTWTRDLDWEFRVGSSLGTVISKLEELVCDVWIDPETLELNMAKERGVDRSVPQLDVDGITVLAGPIIFEKGKNLGKSEVDGVGEIANALVITTSDGWLAVDDTSGSIGKYGRIEAHLDTGVSATVSAAVASTVFEHKANPEVGASYEVIPTPGHVPFVDFNVGDWVIAPNDIGLGVKRRVVSIAVEEDEAGNPLYSVEFDTIFQDNEDKLSDWLKKLGGGALGGQFANSGGGSSSPIGTPNVVPPAPGSSVTRLPLAPQNVEASSRGVWSINGTSVFSEVTVTWNAVTSNTDGTPTVPSMYEVWGHLTENSDNTYELFALTPDNTATIRPFDTGSEWTFKVRAMNSADAVGSFSDPIDHTMEAPNEPMDAPSAPTLTSNKGVLIVSWDGLLAGVAPPPQFRYVYALVAPDVAGSPGTYTRMGVTLSRDGRNINISGLTVGDKYWVTLVAVDGLGIESAASSASSTTLTGIDLGDLDETIQDAIDAAEAAAVAAHSTSGLLLDPGFEANDPSIWSLETADVANVTTTPRTGDRALQIDSAASAYVASKYGHVIPVEEGESYTFGAWVRPLGTGDSVIGGVTPSVAYGATEDSLSSTADLEGSQADLEAEYSYFASIWTVPAGVRFVRPQIVSGDTTGTNSYLIDDLSFQMQIPGALIVDGAISAEKIGAEQVVALHMAAESVAAENIQALAVTAEKMAADSVTANAIAAEAVTANAIAAGAIETMHLSSAVGSELDISSNESVNIVVGQIEGVAGDLEDTTNTLDEMVTYYQFGPEGAVISSPDSPFQLALRNDQIEMLENGNPVSRWDSGQMIVRSFVGEEVVLGNHKLEKYGTGTVVRAL